MTHPANLTRPLIVGVGGFTSEVGKTTLLCELLQAFPNWEAIKTTRGHYRSCGKDPEACCVSDLLGDEPVVRSNRALTYVEGKDTGRYWDAGAANVHWVIATNDQVEKGIEIALSRVQAEGVFVEGNSFAKFIEPDYFVMVTRPDSSIIKPTAKQILDRVSAFYISGESASRDVEALKELMSSSKFPNKLRALPIFRRAEFPKLTSSIREIISANAANFQANPPSQARILSVPWRGVG